MSGRTRGRDVTQGNRTPLLYPFAAAWFYAVLLRGNQITGRCAHVPAEIVCIDKSAPSWIGPATHQRKGVTASETLARVACCRKAETGRNAKTSSESDRSQSSPRQDRNIATDHDGHGTGETKSLGQVSRIHERNRCLWSGPRPRLCGSEKQAWQKG